MLLHKNETWVDRTLPTFETSPRKEFVMPKTVDQSETVEKTERDYPLMILGDITDLRTNPRIPAPRQTVEIKEPNGEFTRSDRLAYRHLASIAQHDLANDGIGEHKTRLQDLNVGSHVGTERIKASIETLQKTLVQTMNDKGEWHSVQLLGEARIKDGWLYFQFPKTIRDYLQKPEIYNRISLRVLYHMKSKYAIILYEILAGYHRMQNPFWRVTLDELHEFLGTKSNKSYRRPAELKRSVLQPAMEEINLRAEFLAQYRMIKRGRSFTHIEFTLSTKSRDQMDVVKALLEEEMPLLG
jgi:hypothetical protein|tara:strand:+ start:502 stop:1395 length:894 start_codon:yes stop_codon:yes gene_type:complete